MSKFDLSGRRAALIISGGDRPGNAYDIERVKRICQENTFPEFGNWITIKTKLELVDGLKSFRDKLSSDTSMLMVVIMAHGSLGHIKVNNQENMELEEIYQLFDNRQCPALRNKPKVFIIQACRKENDCSELPNTDGGVTYRPLGSKLLPTLSDCMEVYAVPPDKRAIRYPEKGSPLFEEMETVFNHASVSKHHMFELFTEVNERLGQRRYHRKQVYQHDDARLRHGQSQLQRPSQNAPGYFDEDSDIGRSLHIVSSMTKKLYLG